MTLIGKVAVIFDNKARPDTTGVYCRRALGELVDVEHFLPDELSRIPRGAFDLYLNVDDGLEYRLPPDLRPCAWWAIDTHLNLPWYLAKGPDFDRVFAAQRDGAEQLRRAGVASAAWLPLACDPEVHRPHEVRKEYDVCFVGHVFPGPRAELLELLRRRFPGTFVGRRFFEDMARAYSAARVVFNRSLRNDVNMRVFEALACGALLATNDLSENGQAELFRDGEHLATYGDADELIDKVGFYLRHDAERGRVAAAGRAAALARHTYRHRMARLLEDVSRGACRAPVPTPGPPGGARELSEVDAGGTALRPNPDPAGAARSKITPDDAAAAPSAERAAAILSLIPEAARSVLILGPGSARLGEALKARQGASVLAIDPDGLGPSAGRTHLEMLLAEGAERAPEGGPPRPFDAVVLDGVLEQAAGPLRLLRRAAGWLAPGGSLVAAFPNVRHHAAQRALLDGDWPFAPEEDPAGGQLRFFTRRQAEKLLFRAGLAAREIRPVPGAGHGEWRRQGGPGAVRAGRLHVAGLSPQDAEEFYAAAYLAEAAVAPPPGWGLTSVVILTHNQLEYTRLCVESVRRLTDEPYELVFVDNGSTDGTPDYLRSLGGVKMVLNADNRGFPAAVNQGVAAAAGRQVLLLNNDTVVTTGWLARLLRALHSAPDVGLAGPCSNCVSGDQEVPAGYEGLAGLDGFAWEWGRAHHGELAETDRLVGFCLLVRREVLEKVGPLDERFGLGCFEDDDYCLRAQRAGYRAVLARDAFVHHFGGRTFAGSGVDFAALMRRNQGLFRDKWEGPPDAAPAVPTPAAPDAAPAAPDTDPATTPAAPAVAAEAYTLRPRVGGAGLLLGRKAVHLSLCLIARDNGRTIAACLKSIRPWVDETVVVDTGSKDQTPKIAERLGARVFHSPWRDNFSAARNESLRHARGRWVFWMDSDDTIDEANGRRLRELALRADDDPAVLGYVMQVHCPGPGPDGGADVTVVDHVKLFRNLPALRFERRIHEQIIPAIRRAGGELAWTDIHVVHSGYDHSPEGQERKKERDLRLLHLELAEEPDHPFTLFNLGMTYGNLGEHREAVDYLRRCLGRSGPGESHVRKAHALLVHSQHQLGRTGEAWDACAAALGQFPRDAELLFRRALLLQDRGDLAGAAEAYRHLLATEDDRHFSSAVRGLRGFLARQNLAVAYADAGEPALAEEQWRLVVAEAPGHRPGWRGLGECLLAQGKRGEAAGLAGRLLADRRLRAEGRLLSGRLAAAAGDFEGARRELGRAARESPGDPEPLHALSRLLFELGDFAAAEAPLRELVGRDPRDAAARHNLGTVYQQTGRPAEAAEEYRESLRLRPDSGATRRALGEAQRAAGLTGEVATVAQRSGP